MKYQNSIKIKIYYLYCILIIFLCITRLLGKLLKIFQDISLKNIISIVLIFVFIFNCVSTFFLFALIKFNLKKELKVQIENGIKDDDLTKIEVSKINPKLFLWTEENKEFKYCDQMYDIVKTKTINNKNYYLCINDIKEKTLIESLLLNKELVKKIKRNFSKLNILYFSVINSITHSSNIMEYIISPLKYYNSYVELVPSPPPKCFSII